jgi:hypothetical protein
VPAGRLIDLDQIAGRAGTAVHLDARKEGLSVNEEHSQHHQDRREPQPEHSDPKSCWIFESQFKTLPKHDRASLQDTSLPCNLSVHPLIGARQPYF